jgi:hypothetical protein
VRRALFALVGAAALLAASPALAGKQHWLGNIDTGGAVTFTINAKNGHRVVNDFVFAGGKAHCSQGDVGGFTNQGAPIGPMAVSDNTFSGNLPVNPNGLIKVRGTITNHHRKAHGTIKLSGDINEFTNCFGKNTWHAARK